MTGWARFANTLSDSVQSEQKAQRRFARWRCRACASIIAAGARRLGLEASRSRALLKGRASGTGRLAVPMDRFQSTMHEVAV
eukprot:418318-Pleurochrysis_carterae.AAC.2